LQIFLKNKLNSVTIVQNKLKKGTSVSYRFIETNKLGKTRFTDMLNNHQERFKEYSYFELYKIIHSKPPVSNSIAFAKLI